MTTVRDLIASLSEALVLDHPDIAQGVNFVAQLEDRGFRSAHAILILESPERLAHECDLLRGEALLIWSAATERLQGPTGRRPSFRPYEAWRT